MRLTVSLLAAAVALAVTAPASAATLLDQTNIPLQSVIPQSVTFTATSGSTRIDFQGYDVPGTLTLVKLFVATTGTSPAVGSNLFGTSFTATPSGCSANGNVFGVGSPGFYGSRDLTFGGACTGLYDTLSQTITTTIGASYTLSFALSNNIGGSNGLRINVGDALNSAVPEPATWAMMLIGFGGIAFSMRRKVAFRLRPQGGVQ